MPLLVNRTQSSLRSWAFIVKLDTLLLPRLGTKTDDDIGLVHQAGLGTGQHCLSVESGWIKDSLCGFGGFTVAQIRDIWRDSRDLAVGGLLWPHKGDFLRGVLLRGFILALKRGFWRDSAVGAHPGPIKGFLEGSSIIPIRRHGRNFWRESGMGFYPLADSSPLPAHEWCVVTLALPLFHPHYITVLVHMQRGQPPGILLHTLVL